jgi:hypothetical protein
MKSRLFLLLNGVGTVNYKSSHAIGNFLCKKERRRRRRRRRRRTRRRNQRYYI